MLNVLKADIFRLRKIALFWVCAIIAVIFGAFWGNLSTLALKMDYRLMPSEHWNMVKENYTSFSHHMGIFMVPIVFCTLLTGIVVIIFVSKEFSSGVIKLTASKGYSRTTLFFSKFIIAVSTYLLIVLLSTLAAFVVSKISISGLGVDSIFYKITKEIWNVYLTRILISVAIVAVALALAFLLRSVGPALAIFIVWFMGEGIAASLISQWITQSFKLEKQFMLSNYLLSGVFYDKEHLIRLSCVLGGFLAAAIAAGWYSFHKKDING